MASPEDLSISSNLEGLRFWRGAPERFQGRLGEIKRLRRTYYEAVFRNRSPEEIGHFVGRLTETNWLHPERVARQGAQRTDPRVVAALQGDNIVGIVHGYSEVSSRLPGVFGYFHRRSKQKPDGPKNYWAYSEGAYAPGFEDISPLMDTLVLDGIGDSRRAVWYPLTEESDLRTTIRREGFTPDLKENDGITDIDREPKDYFGEGASPAYQERWTAVVGLARANVARISGYAEAAEYVNAHMEGAFPA